MQVSLLQAAIFYAWNMDGMNKNDSSGIIGSGYIMANSILPILKAPDEKSALLFKENTEFIVEGNHMKDGAVAVFDSFSLAISGMTNLDCSLIVELHAYNFRSLTVLNHPYHQHNIPLRTKKPNTLRSKLGNTISFRCGNSSRNIRKWKE